MNASLRIGALAALLLLGCDDGAEPDAGGLDAGAEDAGGLDAGEPGCDAGADPFSCETLDPDPACGGSWVVGLTGHVEDPDGTPVVGARTQACLRLFPDDRLVCLSPPETDANGDFAIVIPDTRSDTEPGLRCLNRAVMRVLAPNQPLATTYCPVDFPSDVEPIFAIEDPYVLYPAVPGTVPPRGDETMVRDVVLPDGVELSLAPQALPMSASYDELAGGSVPVAATECFADGVALDGAYVFSPESAVQGGAEVRIPNVDGLSPGAEVDLYIVGGLETFLIDGTMIEEAEMATIGVATVGSDGAFIEGGTETLLPYLTWLTWKAR